MGGKKGARKRGFRVFKGLGDMARKRAHEERGTRGTEPKRTKAREGGKRNFRNVESETLNR